MCSSPLRVVWVQNTIYKVEVSKLAGALCSCDSIHLLFSLAQNLQCQLRAAIAHLRSSIAEGSTIKFLSIKDKAASIRHQPEQFGRTWAQPETNLGL